MSLAPGTRLGAYEVLSLLGAGGMGEVYRARDTRLNRNVAIKVLPDAFVHDADRLARFKREAQVLASLNHPHIAAIYGLEEGPAVDGPAKAGHYVLILELVEGPTLAERIARGPIPVDEALPIARQIAEALEAAHELGIVHRDLKPANIKLTPDGKVKVLDFGLAKAMEPDHGPAEAGHYVLSQSPTITSPAMTMGGVILGTAAYMSPEQARGKVVDKRTDIWAFGCVLYEMLTGTRPFDGDNVTDVLARIIEREPDFSKLPPATPASVRIVLRRTLAKDRSRRLADIADARLELDDPSTATREESRNPGRKVSAFSLSMTGLAVLATVTAVALFLRTPAQPRPIRFSIAPPSPTTAFTSIGAISPDGQTLAMVGSLRGGEGISRILIRRFDSLEWVELPGTEGAGFVFWAPDSRRLGFYAGAQRKLKKIDTVGGVPEIICDAGGTAPFGGATWSADGTILFVNSVMSGSGVFRVNAAGGTPIAVTTVDRSKGETAHLWPHFLPNGRDFLLLVLATNPENDAVHAASVDGTEKSQLVRASSMAVYAPSGHVLYLRGSTLIAQPFDARARRISGEATAIGENVGTNAYLRGSFSVSRDALAYWTGEFGNDVTLGWRDRSGRELGDVADPGYYRTFDLSPDEKRLAVHIHEGWPGAGNMWVVDLERKVPSRFTRTSAHDVAPLWSPDGRRLVFRSINGGAQGIFETSLVAGSSPRQLVDLKHAFTLLSWSGDGRFLLYDKVNASDGRNDRDLFAFSFAAPDTPVPVATTQFNERWGDFSPDSRWVVFQSDESGRQEIYIQSFPRPDMRVRVSGDGGSEPRWSKTAKEIFFVRPDRVLVAVPITMGAQPVIGAETPLFRVNAAAGVDSANHYQVSKDGQRILTTGDSTTVPLVVTVSLNWAAALRRAE